MTFQLFLVGGELAYRQGMLALLQTKFIDLVTQLLLGRFEFLAKDLDVTISLLQLRLRLRRDLFLNADDLFQDFDVLLKGARHLLVLLQLLCQEHFNAAKGL